MRPKAKIWLEREDGSYLVGPGAMHLLRAVAEAGSLKGSAKQGGRSYRKACAQQPHHAWIDKLHVAYTHQPQPPNS
ncbi:MAG: hypothetical protein K6T35_12560, partial [Meiothermus silvanus]|nr:hypothetical protein [Allomeiothermus silvanus]